MIDRCNGPLVIVADFGKLGRVCQRRWGRRQCRTMGLHDIDRTRSAGVSINRKQWGWPDDTIGLAGVVNGISGGKRPL